MKATVTDIHPDVRRILDADQDALQVAIDRVDILRELGRIKRSLAELDTFYQGERNRRELQEQEAAARLAAFDLAHGQGRLL